MCKNMLISIPIALIMGSVIGVLGVFLQLHIATVLVIAVATGGYFELLNRKGYFDSILGNTEKTMGTEYED